MLPPLVKICCIASVTEARLAQHAGAAALGLVSAMPSGRGVIADGTLAAIAGAMRGSGLRSFLLDAIPLDSGNPALVVKELGGTGRTHDWSLSLRIREAVAPLPLWLAGGLRADNVGRTVAAVRPYGLDLCTGVRTQGRLDRAKLKSFMAAVQAVTVKEADDADRRGAA